MSVREGSCPPALFRPKWLPGATGQPRVKIAARVTERRKGEKSVKSQGRTGTKGGREWFWASDPGCHSLVEVGQVCKYCGWWSSQGVYYREQVPDPGEEERCLVCGTTCMPAVVDLGAMGLAAAAV